MSIFHHEDSPVMGQASCPYCKTPLTTEIDSYTEHIENCKKNPKNWDDVDDEAKQWIKNPKSKT